MHCTGYTLQRCDDEGEPVETIDLLIVGDVEYEGGSRSGHPDRWSPEVGSAEVYYAIVEDGGRELDILGMISDREEELREALVEAAAEGRVDGWSGREPPDAESLAPYCDPVTRREYDRTEVLAGEVER